jgi:hypothetical protein
MGCEALGIDGEVLNGNDGTPSAHSADFQAAGTQVLRLEFARPEPLSLDRTLQSLGNSLAYALHLI